MLAWTRPLLTLRMLGLHLLVVVATTATVLLGLWQYHAWASHRDDQATSLADAPAQPLAQVMSPDDPFPAGDVGRPVTMSGRWLPGSTVYVADRNLHGSRGVWAVTPVEVCPAAGGSSCSAAPAMLVVRGWARTVAAAPPAPSGTVAIAGWLQPGEGSGVADPDPTDDVIPQMRVADAIQHVRQDLYGGYVISEKVVTSDKGSLQPVTPSSLPSPGPFTGLRNLLYAIEWWVFGGFAVYLWWRWCRDELDRQREAADPEVSEITGVRSSP